jgi:two-component system, cell cycle sensor histidine kinase and response regulator CckA
MTLPSQHSPAVAPRTILVVDDSMVVRDVTRKMLQQAGYTVLFASDGQSALRISREHAGAIDLLVTDVVMPGMPGQELAKRLVQNRPEIRVLFISGLVQETETRGGGAFLKKPYTQADLIDRVQKLLP